MVIDAHTYLWDDAGQLGASAARKLGAWRPEPWRRPLATLEMFDQAMGAVDVALVLGQSSAETGARVTMEQVAARVSARKGRCLGLAGIDPLTGAVKAAVDKAQSLGLVGVVVSPSAQGFHPAHTRALRLYELCEARGLPVMVLSADGLALAPEAKLEFGQPALWDEVARTFPGLRIVIGSMGLPWVRQTLALLAKQPHVYADLSGLVGRRWELYTTLCDAADLNVTEKLLLGSGFPLCTPAQAIEAIYSVPALGKGLGLPTVPRRLLSAIVERDALACLGISPPVVAPPAPAQHPVQEAV